MLRTDLLHRGRKCPTCGQLVHILRNGLYRRHFTTGPDGRRHLCAASHTPARGVAHALRKLDL